MKPLKDAFIIIIKCFGGYSDFFQDAISFDRTQLDIECRKLNDEKNNVFKKESEKQNIPYIPLTLFEVLNLKDAIKKFEVDVIFYNSSDDWMHH